MPDLPADILARAAGADPTKVLREDLEDALKEYTELDLLVELLQNALDSLDFQRYVLICRSAGKDPHSPGTIAEWNTAVLEAIENDYNGYSRRRTAAERAIYYQQCTIDNDRRTAWWTTLGGRFGVDPHQLSASVAAYRPKLTITIQPGPPHWIEVEDDGIGMADVPNSFRHQSSTKRRPLNQPRRLGTRGSHGWGLTAVLAMSDRVEVISRVAGGDAQAYVFANYASFAAGADVPLHNENIDLTQAGQGSGLSQRIRTNGTGTHIRVHVGRSTESNLLGHTLTHYNPGRFTNLLRLYTPVGQVNDYIFHPAYHTLRKADIDITLCSMQTTRDTRRVDFDIFRISEGHALFPSYTYDNYVNAGMPRSVSVHTVHRARRANAIYLSAADLQPAKELLQPLERSLISQELLPGYIDEYDDLISIIPRGFQLALSGGMRSEHVARQPRSISAAFRGIVLAETAPPTLGRKHVVDQRQAIAKAAADHEQQYDDVRRRVLPEAVPPPATPAMARWKRDFFTLVRTDVASQVPPSESLRVWASRASREARVMIVFGELLGHGRFGDFRILRAHLTEKYDFAFLYRATLGRPDAVPTMAVANEMQRGGYAIWDRGTGLYQVYGIGEFKAVGDDLFDDFNEDDPRKAADTIDLLVCWDFDADVVGDQSWVVANADPTNTEFPGQTHVWIPRAGNIRRTRRLPVISINHLVQNAVASGQFTGPPSPWPGLLPDVYY
jgi:hypothetical protein